jgi:site-specific DNA-cytosine methylase
MQRAGYRVLAAIDHNSEAIATFKANFPKDTIALCKDLTSFSPIKLVKKKGHSCEGCSCFASSRHGLCSASPESLST